MRLNISTLAAGVLFFGLLLLAGPSVHAWTAWQIVGFAIVLPAFALFVLARIQLGRAFSVQAKATSLVTRGIYARIRHPIYVFGMLMLVGTFVFVHRPWWLLIFVVLMPVQLLRVRKEEQVLRDKFGDVYLTYKQKTWF